MIIIGICGSSGSGKSTVCEYFAEKGVPILDCDKIYHELISRESDCLKEIGSVFGSVYVQNGALNRKELGRIVFSDPDKLKLLNQISHRHVLREIEIRIKDLENGGAKLCMIDAPMLYEAGLQDRCDYVCAVVSDTESQLQRMCRRDGISLSEAKLRLDHQISPDELRKRADFIIENTGSVSALQKACDDFLRKIITLKGN